MASRGDERRRLIRRRLADPARRARVDPVERLRQRLLQPPSAEFAAWLERPHREAAVLLGLIERDGGPAILLTERATHLAHHPGQVSFPGGSLDPGETPEQAALREAEEEVALPGSQVEILGSLEPQLTGTGFIITPIVGWIDPVFRPRPEPAEVRAAFEVPLSHLQSPANRQQSTRERFMTRFVTDEFYFDRYLIWGATASILSQFLEILHEK